jgi:hypothetical protein
MAQGVTACVLVALPSYISRREGITQGIPQFVQDIPNELGLSEPVARGSLVIRRTHVRSKPHKPPVEHGVPDILF